MRRVYYAMLHEKSMKILLFGAQSQLGADLQKTNPGWTLVPLAHADADVTDADLLKKAVDTHRPNVVINTAAYNRTEDVEASPEAALQINSLGPRNIARACQATGARLLTYSSDYVFDGKKRTPYIETDAPFPINLYGLTKWGGECLTLSESPRHWVVRTASLYGAAGSRGKGGNFVETILQKARAGQRVEVVDDIVMSPTSTMDLAKATWAFLQADAPGGVYHINNSGACSWYDFAAKTFEFLNRPPPVAIHAHDHPSKIQRPAYSALASERWMAAGLEPLRPWADALKDYLRERGHLTS